MEQTCHLRRGDVSGADYLISMFMDSFIHGWDLAKATGQGAALNPELLAIAVDLAKQREERFRTSGAFGQGRVPDPGDDALDQARAAVHPRPRGRLEALGQLPFAVHPRGRE